MNAEILVGIIFSVNATILRFTSKDEPTQWKGFWLLMAGLAMLAFGLDK